MSDRTRDTLTIISWTLAYLALLTMATLWVWGILP